MLWFVTDVRICTIGNTIVIGNIAGMVSVRYEVC